MKQGISATRVTVSTFGALVGLAGIEHDIGEMRQGNEAPDGMIVTSWPRSGLFRILGGEPAMTVVPSLLATGILAILVSLIFILWATVYVRREHGGLVLILLSGVMLLVGGGFGPPIIGVIAGVAATRIDTPLTRWRARPSSGPRRFLGRVWPWSLAAGVITWLFLFPGSIILDHLVGVNNPDLVVLVLTFSAFGVLLLTILAGFAHDVERQTNPYRAPSTSEGRPT